jgi:hypothetical protein
MTTTRDLDIKEFLKEFKVANTTTIANLFFPSLSACQKRLKKMVDSKEIKRDRDSINNEYIYYIKRPQQLKHSLLVTKFYSYMSKQYNIATFKIEPVLENIRPDAVFGYEKHGKKYIGLLEVEISNKGFNFLKYEKFYSSETYKNFYPVMPTIFIVSDTVKLQQTKVNYELLNLKTICNMNK